MHTTQQTPVTTPAHVFTKKEIRDSLRLARRQRHRRRNRIIKSGVAAAAMAAMAISAFHESPRLDGFLLVHKPANVYYSQAAYSKLQMQSKAIGARSHDTTLAQYFPIPMIQQNVPVGRMIVAADEIKTLYRRKISVLSGEEAAEKIINRAAGIDVTPTYAVLAAQSLYSSTALSTLQSITANMQTFVNPQIANFYYTTMLYYRMDRGMGAIEGYVYMVATDQNVTHKGVSALQESYVNTSIAQNATQNLALIYASGGNITQVDYTPTSSARALYEDTNNTVERKREKNVVVLVTFAGGPPIVVLTLLGAAYVMESRKPK